MGTKITELQITDVIDGDTIKVLLDGKEESLRLTVIDTEESKPGGTKPVTKAGVLVAEMAQKYFRTASGNLANVDIEFDTNDPVEVCLKRHRDNYGRVLCYVHKEGENYNLKLVREGWSPYFIKYGYSRVYHKEFTRVEAEAQAKNLMIWDSFTNAGGPSRDYTSLIPWWSLRAQIVEDYRKSGIVAGVLSVRLDYENILRSAELKNLNTIFCDLQDGINKWPGDGALIYAGSKFHKFNLWISDATANGMFELVRLIEKRYAHQGRGYIYVTGKVKFYREIPEIELVDISQLSDFPPE